MVTTAPNGDAPPVPLHAAFDLAALRRQRFIARDDLRGIRTALTAILIAAILVLAVGSSGALTGYRWGVARKERLLADERRRSST